MGVDAIRTAASRLGTPLDRAASPTAVIVRAAALPSVVLVVATALLLGLGVDRGLVLITYGAAVGALALGLALAFGLGGRELARTLLEDAHATAVWRAQAQAAVLEVAHERGYSEHRDGEFASA